MSHIKTLRLRGAAIALAGVLALAGCATSPGTNGGPTPTPSSSTPGYPDEPSHYEARVIDVLAGDELRVQLTGAVYEPSISPTGKREVLPVDPKTLVVNDASYDSPEAGECGFEEAKEFLITDVFRQPGPGWVLDEDAPITVSLRRDTLDKIGVPATDADGVEQYLIGVWPESPSSRMLQNGYGRVGELIPTDSNLYGTLSGNQDSAQRNDGGRGLWSLCGWTE